jgi:4-amino-4-deoxy-L-arabinose transferase-like glycosyltransferase
MTDAPPTVPDSPGVRLVGETGVSRRRLALVVLATVVVCAYLVGWAVGTDPTIGDEARHFRRAVNYFETPLPHFRTDHDPAYPFEGPGAIPYFDACLWHEGLALLWKLLGRVSLPVAQIYHAAFVFLLAMFTYLAGRTLYGHRGGLWAWGLVLTLPMNILFGMIFYQEIPLLAFTAMAIVCILRGRAVWLGVAMAAMFLTKSAIASVLIPSILVAAFFAVGDTWRRRFLRTAIALAVAFLVLLPDVLWHLAHFGRPFMLTYGNSPLSFPGLQLPSPRMTAVPLSILNPLAVLSMFGVSGLVVAVLGSAMAVVVTVRSLLAVVADGRRSGVLAALRRLPDSIFPSALVGALPLFVYVLVYVVMLPRAYDVRYLHPTMLMACLLAAGPLGRLSLRKNADRSPLLRAAAWLLVLAMAGQLLTVPPAVRRLRHLPPQIEAGYEWVRLHTAPDSRFLYNQESLVALTGRPVLWAAIIPRYFFSVPERERARILRYFDVRYIAIDSTRRLDNWTTDIEPMGFPVSWLRAVPGRAYLERVYPSPEGDALDSIFIVYRVNYDRIPPDWIADIEPGNWQFLVEEQSRKNKEKALKALQDHTLHP